LKVLKSTRMVPAITPEEMLRAAGHAAPQQPPAVAAMEGAEKSAMLSVRMMEATLEALASYAIDQRTTQRRVIAEALAKHGVRVSARDLQDRPQPRRRGRRLTTIGVCAIILLGGIVASANAKKAEVVASADTVPRVSAPSGTPHLSAGRVSCRTQRTL
jgi:hypothetical protein